RPPNLQLPRARARALRDPRLDARRDCEPPGYSPWGVGGWRLEVGGWQLTTNYKPPTTNLSRGCRRRLRRRILSRTRRHRDDPQPVELVHVHLLIADPVAVLVNPSQRLVEETGFRIALRHGAFHHVQLVLVHRDEGHRARL